MYAYQGRKQGGGVAAGLLPPPWASQGGVPPHPWAKRLVLCLISNYKNALRFIWRTHFPCQLSFKRVSDWKYVIFIQEYIWSWSWSFVPILGGFLPNLRGFVLNLRDLFLILDILFVITILEGFVPLSEGFVPISEEFVPILVLL